MQQHRVTLRARRAADRRSRWPSTRPSTSTTSRRCGLVFSGAAPLGAELARELHASASAARCVQGYGMTETSPVDATSARRARRDQARLGRPARCRTPRCRIVDARDRRGRRRRASTASSGCAARRSCTATSNDPEATAAHDRRRRLAAHRRHRLRRRRRLLLHRRPRQGADQVQGLPGGARRARGAAAHPPGGRRRGGDPAVPTRRPARCPRRSSCSRRADGTGATS